MTPDPISVSEAVEGLSERGVRRAPVIDETGHLVGIVTLDDVNTYRPQMGGKCPTIATACTSRLGCDPHKSLERQATGRASVIGH